MIRRFMIVGVVSVVAYVLSGVLGDWRPTGAVADSQQSAEGPCELGSLRGAYALHGSGEAGKLPVAFVGRIVFDGHGRLSGTNTEVFNGNEDNTSYHGTYTVDSTCRGVAKVEEEHENPAMVNLHRFAAVGRADGERFFFVLANSSYRGLGENPLPADTSAISGVGERIDPDAVP